MLELKKVGSSPKCYQCAREYYQRIKALSY